MLEEYLRWYEYGVEALGYDVANAAPCGGARTLVVAGMGGSGIAGDVLASLAAGLPGPRVHVVKDFSLPHNLLGEDVFVLAISYSGDTLETLTALLSALGRVGGAGVIASGGELLDVARRYRLPHVAVRRGLVPRLAFPVLLVASLKLLSAVGIDLVPWSAVTKAIEALRDVEGSVRVAHSISGFLRGSRAALVVAPARYGALALRFKNELNENAKLPAKVELVPELFHNDVVGWEGGPHPGWRALILTSDVELENKLLRLYRRYLGGVGIESLEVELQGGPLERHLVGSLIAGLASVRLAQERGVDPLLTTSISLYKSELRALRTGLLGAVGHVM